MLIKLLHISTKDINFSLTCTFSVANNATILILNSGKSFFFFFFPWWIFSHDSLENQSRLLFLVQITQSVSHAWHCLLCIEESQSSHLDFLNNVFTFHLTQILPNSLKDKHTDISIHFYKLSLLLYLISDIRPAF